MDAPQFPDAEASAEPVGGQPTGQAAVFRRALDSQVEPSDPSKALVPTDPHDHSSPVNLEILRILLASGKPADALNPDGTPGSMADMPPVFPAPATLAIPTAPVPAVPPSASGPTVVMPAVSAPTLHAPTTIAAPANASPANTSPANAMAAAPMANTPARAPATFAGIPVMMNPAEVSVPRAAGGDHGDRGDEPRAHGSSPRHNGKPSRLPTAVLISALLGACAGVALVLINAGHSPDPLAPTALPTKVVTFSPSPSPSPSPKPSPKPRPSPSPSPSHASPSPSHSPSPSPSPSPSHSASPSPSTVASFATIYWTNSPDSRVADIQNRLAQLNYLQLTRDGQYADSYRTQIEAGWRAHPDSVGIYQNATDAAVNAFEFDYMQHDQGSPPGPGCSYQTYQALVAATS